MSKSEQRRLEVQTANEIENLKKEIVTVAKAIHDADLEMVNAMKYSEGEWMADFNEERRATGFVNSQARLAMAKGAAYLLYSELHSLVRELRKRESEASTLA